MKTIYLVRHGQTDLNATLVTGGPDDKLSELGLKQAELVSKRLSSNQIEKIISSPYMRAKQTAEQIAKVCGLQVCYSDLFIETRSPSELTGKGHDDPDTLEIRKLRKMNWGAANWHYSDEENYYDTLARAKQAVQYLLDHKENKLVVITHGSFLRMIVSYIMLQEDLTPELSNLFYQGLGLSNTGIVLLHLAKPNKFRLITWNDTAHLDEESNTWKKLPFEYNTY